jgi:hypothetical protein
MQERSAEKCAEIQCIQSESERMREELGREEEWPQWKNEMEWKSLDSRSLSRFPSYLSQRLL